MNTYGSLAQSARSQQLKSAKVILWVVGVLSLILNGVMFAGAEAEVDKEIDKELGKTGGSIAQVESLSTENQAAFKAARLDAIKRVKLIYGAFATLGAVFIGCALLVSKKPVIATVTGLVLYLGAKAATVAILPETLMHGLLIQVFIVIGLVKAIKTAIAVERQERMEQLNPPPYPSL